MLIVPPNVDPIWSTSVHPLSIMLERGSLRAAGHLTISYEVLKVRSIQWLCSTIGSFVLFLFVGFFIDLDLKFMHRMRSGWGNHFDLTRITALADPRYCDWLRPASSYLSAGLPTEDKTHVLKVLNSVFTFVTVRVPNSSFGYTKSGGLQTQSRTVPSFSGGTRIWRNPAMVTQNPRSLESRTESLTSYCVGGLAMMASIQGTTHLLKGWHVFLGYQTTRQGWYYLLGNYPRDP